MRDIAKAAEAAPPQGRVAVFRPFFGREPAIDGGAAGRKCQPKSLKSPDSRKEMADFSAGFSLKTGSNDLVLRRLKPE